MAASRLPSDVPGNFKGAADYALEELKDAIEKTMDTYLERFPDKVTRGGAATGCAMALMHEMEHLFRESLGSMPLGTDYVQQQAKKLSRAMQILFKTGMQKAVDTSRKMEEG